MAADYTLYACMILMLIAGTINMVFLKFQHMQHVPMKSGGEAMPFDQPILQACFMMIGETLCLLVYFIVSRNEPKEKDDGKKAPTWVFLVPCCCDLTATALMCAGLAFVAVSVVQMCRGTIVIFVCLMSWMFLGRTQKSFQLAGVLLVTVGIVLVALSAFSGGSETSSLGTSLSKGIALVIFAQVFQAGMFVYEEKIMSQYSVEPLQVVGMEGVLGVFVSGILMGAMHLLGWNDIRGALYQIQNSPHLVITILLSMVAVAVFNFSGATVTQRSSATARTTIKIASTICIWGVELAAGWNVFKSLQLFGFVFVAAGTLIYNRIVAAPCLDYDEKLRP